MGMRLCGTIADLAYAQGQISGKQRTEARNGRDRTPTFSGVTISCLADMNETALGNLFDPSASASMARCRCRRHGR